MSSSIRYTFANRVNRSLVAGFVQIPSISLSPQQPGTHGQTWPTNDSGLILQQTAVLGSVNWATAPTAIIVVETNNHVGISPLGGSQFFRLFRPRLRNRRRTVTTKEIIFPTKSG